MEQQVLELRIRTDADARITAIDIQRVRRMVESLPPEPSPMMNRFLEMGEALESRLTTSNKLLANLFILDSGQNIREALESQIKLLETFQVKDGPIAELVEKSRRRLDETRINLDLTNQISQNMQSIQPEQPVVSDDNFEERYKKLMGTASREDTPVKIEVARAPPVKSHRQREQPVLA